MAIYSVASSTYNATSLSVINGSSQWDSERWMDGNVVVVAKRNNRCLSPLARQFRRHAHAAERTDADDGPTIGLYCSECGGPWCRAVAVISSFPRVLVVSHITTYIEICEDYQSSEMYYKSTTNI